MFVVDAAIDHGNTDASPSKASIPGRSGTDSSIGDVVRHVHRMVDCHRRDIGIGFQGRQCADRNGEGRTVNHVQLRMQATAPSLHGGVMGGRRRLLILHNDPDGLILGLTLLGLCETAGELRSDTERPGRFASSLVVPVLTEGHAGRQQQHRREALAPRGAVSLPALRLLRFVCTDHKSHPSFYWGKDRASYPPCTKHGRDQVCEGK